MVPTVAVSIDVHESDGSALEGAIVTARLTGRDEYDGQVIDRVPETTTTAADGSATLNLFPNVLGSRGTMYQVTVRHPTTNRAILKAVVQVPNEACNLLDLIGVTPQETEEGELLSHLPPPGLVAKISANGYVLRSVVGTLNQVNVDHGDGIGGDIELSLPQDIAPSSSPTFAALTVAGLLTAASLAVGSLTATSLSATSLSATDISASGQFFAADGSIANPAYTFTNDTNLGVYRVAGDNMGVVAGGGFWHSSFDASAGSALAFKLRQTGAIGWSSVAGDAGASASCDLSLFRGAAGVLEQRNGVNAQEFRLYRTYTDAANYERLSISSSASSITLSAAHAGTGTAKALRLSSVGSALIFQANNTDLWQLVTDGSWRPQSSNAYDFGSSGNLPRSIYWGTQALAPDGTSGNPAYAFASSTNTGFRLISAGNVMWQSAGTASVWLNASGFGLASTGLVRWTSGSDPSSGTDTVLLRDAANTVGQRNGTNAQLFRMYNTYTDGSNYERADLSWVTNTFQIATAAAGTGSARTMMIGTRGSAQLRILINNTERWVWDTNGHLVPSAADTYNVGASGTRVGSVFTGVMDAAGNVTLGDAAGDTLTINAGTWTLGSNVAASRAAGAVAAGTVNILSHAVTASGDVGGTSNPVAWRWDYTLSGANAVNVPRLAFFNYVWSGTAANSSSPRVVSGNYTQSGTATTGTLRNFCAESSITGSGNIGTNIGFDAVAPVLSSTGVITTFYGFRSSNLGHATLVGTAVGFKADDMTASATAARGFQSSLASGTGKHNLYIDGTAVNYIAAQIQGGDGTSAAPMYSFSSETGLGFWRSGAAVLDFALSSGSRLRFSTGENGAGRITFSSASDTFSSTLLLDAANTLAQRNTTNAQTFRVYNTFTDTSNGEWGTLRWASNVFEIGAFANGTGTNRVLQFSTGGSGRWQITTSGHLMPVASNSYDIGSLSTAVVRAIYVANSGFKIRDTGNDHTLSLASGENLSADRTLTFTVTDGDRTLTMSGNASLNQNVLTTSSPTFAALTLSGLTGNLTVGGTMMPTRDSSANTTTVAGDANGCIRHPAADTNNRTFTIDSNANVAYAIGTMITFVNEVNTLTIAITADTLVFAGTGGTGSRTLAANGVATAVKVSATRWYISGTGLT